MQIYQLYFSRLNGIVELGVVDFSIEERPQTFTEWTFSLNVALSLPYDVSFDTAPDIDISKERIDQIIGKNVIKINSQSKGSERSI